MFRPMWLPLSMTLALLVLVSSAAGDEGRKLPKLVPSFDGDSGRSAKTTDSQVRRTAFQRAVDRVRPSTGTVQPKNPSTLSRLNSSTKRMFAKTKRVLIPWSGKKPQQARPRPAKEESTSFWRKTTSPSPKRSLFGSWFAKEEPKPKPSTVSEFLGQPKP